MPCRLYPDATNPQLGVRGRVTTLRMRLRPLALATLLLALPPRPRRPPSRLDRARRRLRPRRGDEPVRRARLRAARRAPTATSSATTTRAPSSPARRAEPEVRVLLQTGGSREASAASRAPSGRSALDAVGDLHRRVRRAGRRGAARPRAASVIGRYQAPLRLAGRRRRVHAARAAPQNGVRDGALPRRARGEPGGRRGLIAVNALDLEDYVRGVVRAESPAAWPAEALKAQARRRAHVRDHDAQAGDRASTSTPTRARRSTAACRAENADDRRGRRRHGGRGRHLRRAARSSPTSSRPPAGGPRTSRTRSSARAPAVAEAASRTRTTTSRRGTAGGRIRFTRPPVQPQARVAREGPFRRSA